MKSNLWIRDLNGNAQQAHILFKDAFEIITARYKSIFPPNTPIQNLSPQQFCERIISFNMFYDTALFVMSDAIILSKFSIDFETGIVTTSSNGTQIITIYNNMKYVDHFFFPEDKKLTLGFLLQCEGLTPNTYQIRPLLYSLDLEDNILSVIYNKNSHLTDFFYVLNNINIVNSSAMTFDKLRNIYNVSFIRKTSKGMYLFSINLKQVKGEFEVIKTKVIEPI